MKKKNVGRPSVGGVKKTVSMTLPQYVWDFIDDSGMKQAEFFRKLALEKVRQSNIDDYIKED